MTQQVAGTQLVKSYMMLRTHFKATLTTKLA